MQKALNYFMHTWDSVMAYRHDGRYEIDNSVAERSIRPQTIERKNSLIFGSHKGVETSAVYHTFIATCRMRALSFCEFLKKYLTAILNGRTDYENLTPVLLGYQIKNPNNHCLFFASCFETLIDRGFSKGGRGNWTLTNFLSKS